MKKTLLIFLLIIPFIASGQIKKTVEVKEVGTLYSLIENDISEIEELIVSGRLNSSDFTIMKNMVKNGKLTKIDLSNCEIPKEYEYTWDNSLPDKSFENCDKLQNIILPKKLSGIGADAFLNCSSLTEIDYPETLITIRDQAFKNCSGLRKIILPSNLRYLFTAVFYKCSNLEEVVFMHDSASNDTIDISQHCFTNCTKLRSITFPVYFKAGHTTFSGCPFEKIVCKSTNPPKLDKTTFDDEIKQNCKVYVPKGSYKDYAWNTDYWAEFKNIIEGDGNVLSNSSLNITDFIYGSISTIIIKTEKSTLVSIYNLSGQLVKTFNHNSGFSEININKGVYIVSTEFGNSKIVVK